MYAITATRLTSTPLVFPPQYGEIKVCVHFSLDVLKISLLELSSAAKSRSSFSKARVG